MAPFAPSRSLFGLTILVIAALFFAEMLPAFHSARAASTATPAASATLHAKSTATPTHAPKRTPSPIPVSADTTGIMVFAVLIVIVVVVGAILGVRRPHIRKIA